MTGRDGRNGGWLRSFLGRKTRVISAPLRRALKARDGTRCAWPGCTCRGLQAHHVQAWAEGGPTVLDNLVSTCALHHHLVHEGGYAVEASSDGGFRFFRPDGKEVIAAPPSPRVSDEPVHALAEQWVLPGVAIGPSTGRPTWQGERADYDWMGDCLRSLASGG